jgi:hypothetical protein
MLMGPGITSANGSVENTHNMVNDVMGMREGRAHLAAMSYLLPHPRRRQVIRGHLPPLVAAH